MEEWEAIAFDNPLSDAKVFTSCFACEDLEAFGVRGAFVGVGGREVLASVVEPPGMKTGAFGAIRDSDFGSDSSRMMYSG